MAIDAVTEISFDQPYMTEVVGSLNMEEERDNMMDQNPFQGFNFSYCLIPEVASSNHSLLSSLCQGWLQQRASHPPDYLMIAIQFFYALVCLLGLLGNSLVIYVVLRFSKMHTVTNTYILHLAMADECFLVGIPFLIATMFMREWPFGTTMCKIYFTTTSINQITSSLFLMVLSADRYVAVCHPISSPRFRTGVISKVVSLSAWLMSAFLMLPIFLYATTVTRRAGPDGHLGHSCNVIWLLGDTEGEMVNSQTTFTFYIFIFGFLGPLAFILIFYVLVIIKLRSVGPRGQERSQSKRKSHRKVTKLVLTVITVYIICWLPHWVTQLALISQPPDSAQSNTLVIVILLADCLQYSNSAMNPVLYAFLSENFKKSFRKAMHCDKRDQAALNHPDYSATTRRSRRGPRFTAVPPQDEDKEAGDLSTGITGTSRSSKYTNCSTSSEACVPKPNVINVVNGSLAPPVVM